MTVSAMRPYALLILLTLAALLPGIAALPPVDRDEPRYMQASRQMVDSGDYVDIRFQDVSRYKKPIGIYWLQSAVVKASGMGADAPAWVYRLVSVFAGIVSVCAIFAIGRSLFGERAGWIAGIALAGLFGLAFEGRIAKTDATLLAAALFAQGALAHIYVASRQARAPSRAAFWLFWIAQGAALLIKGPIILLLSLLTILALGLFGRHWRWLRALKPLPGVAVMALIAAPWIIAISLKVGWSFWQESVGKDMLGKAVSGQESHGFPPGYYFLTYSLMLWPFGAMALQGGLSALNRFRTDPRLAFMLAWYIPWWIFCEILPTKLPHYMLPAYPALLLLMAWWLESGGGTPAPAWQRWFAHAARFGVALVGIGLAAIAVGLPLWFGQFSAWGLLGAAALLAAGWLGLGLAPGWPPLRRVAATTIASLVGIGLLVAKVLPSVDQVWPAREIARTYKAVAPCAGSRLVSAGFGEPSLVFLTKADTLFTNGAGAAQNLLQNRCNVAAIAASQQDAFQAAFAQSPQKPVEVGRVESLNFSKGSAVAITLYRLPQGGE